MNVRVVFKFFIHTIFFSIMIPLIRKYSQGFRLALTLYIITKILSLNTFFFDYELAIYKIQIIISRPITWFVLKEMQILIN